MDKKLITYGKGKLYLLLVLVLGALMFGGTFSNEAKAKDNKSQQSVTKTKLNYTERSMTTKEICQLEVYSLPEGGKCKWYSNREDVAYVTQKGKVTAKTAGKATITCTVLVKGKQVKTLKAIVNVKNPEVSSVKINSEGVILEYGKTKKLSASTSPKNALNPKIYWKSDNESIAKVSSTGIVTAVSQGNTLIRAYTENKKEGTCLVTVNPKKEEPAKVDKVNFTVNGDFIVGETMGNIEFFLSKRAADIFLEIVDENNQCVRTITLGASEQKVNLTSWDGLDDYGKPVKDGSYAVKVNADGRSKKSGKLKVYEKGDFSKGNGTAENPYRIKDSKDLEKVRNHHNKYFVQTGDINMSGTYFKPLFSSRKKFSGTYDGGGYKILNLSIDNGTTSYCGLFAAIGEEGTVKNVHLKNCNMIGGNYTAGIAGKNSGTITDCSVTGWVHGKDYVAGVCGYNEGTVRGCSALAIVTGNKVGIVVIEKY